MERFEAILWQLPSNWQIKERGEDNSFCCEGIKVNNMLDSFLRKFFFVLFHFICLFMPVLLFYFDLPSVKNTWNTHRILWNVFHELKTKLCLNAVCLRRLSVSMTGFRNLFLKGLQILFTAKYCLTRESHYVVILLKVALDIGKCHVQPRALTWLWKDILMKVFHGNERYRRWTGSLIGQLVKSYLQ